jgi:trimeric autotransporter adhesin
MRSFILASFLVFLSTCISATPVHNNGVCDVPIGMTTNTITSISAKLNWAPVVGAVSYRINWRKTGAATWLTALVPVTAATVPPQFVANGLTASTTYEWQVKTLCGTAGESAASSNTLFTTLVPPVCGIPSGLTTSAITTNSTTFNWTSVPSAVAYIVTWHVVGTSTWQTATAPNLSFVANGLLANTAYEWKVKSVCSTVATSDFSPAVTFTTTGGQTCAIPAGLNTTGLTSSSVTFNWAAVTGATAYTVTWRATTSASWQTATVTNLSFLANGLLSNTNFEWKVKSICSATSSSVFSAVKTFKTLVAPACAIPAGLTTTNITANSAKLNWSTVSGATAYIVNYRKVGTSTWLTGTTQTISFTTNTLTPNTNYEWKVKTVCSGTTTSDFSPVKTFTTLAAPTCAIPAGLTTTNITGTSAKFNWTAVTGAQSYIVSWHIVSNSTWSTATVTTATHTANGLSAGASYEWKVKTVCSTTSTSNFSPIQSFVTTAAPTCAIPTGLNNTNITSSSATLNWIAISGASGYLVNWRVLGAATWQTGTAQGPLFTANNLAANTNYEWKVKTICSTGASSDFSALRTFTTLASATCAIPTGLSTTNIATNKATFNWTATAGAAGYIVNWRVIGATTWQTGTVQVLPYVAIGLLPNTKYEWKVKTICSNALSSDFSTVQTLSTLANSVCAIPTGLTTTNISQNTAVLGWAPVTSALSYRISYRAVGAANWLTATVPATLAGLPNYTVIGLATATNYEWKIKTVCTNGGESDFSVVGTFTTLSAPSCGIPTALTVTNITASSAQLNWLAVTGGAYYTVSWHVVGTTAWQTASVQTNTFSASGLLANTLYEWKVKTTCTSGSASDFSAAQPFTTLTVPLCPIPTGLSTTNILANGATFGWVPSAPNTTSLYTVSWRKTGATSWISATSPNTSFFATGLLPNSTYEWKVKTICSNTSSSDFSAVQTCTTLALPVCTTPVGLNTSNITANLAKFNWDNVTGATSYRVSWHVAGMTNWQTIVAPTNSFTVIGLLANTNYEWKVKTICSNGTESDFSAAQTFTTLILLNPEGSGSRTEDLRVTTQVFPNPVSKTLQVWVNTKSEGTLRISLLDMRGAVVVRLNEAHVASENQYQIPVADLPNGIYLLEIHGAQTGVSVEKIMVSH